MYNPQHIVLFHHFREFLRTANNQNIVVAPLKGASLLTSVYPPDENRGLLADIDFLVKDEDLSNVCDLLEKQGFKNRILPGRKSTASQLKDAGYYLKLSPTQSILFEPHRYLVQPERHPIDYNALWERTIDSTFEDVPCKRLTPEDTFLHLVIHLFTDSFVGLNKTLRDLELIAEKQTPDFNTIIQRSKEWQCSRATWLTLMLLQRYKNIAIDQKLISDIAPNLAIQKILLYLVPNVDGFRYRHLGQRKQQAVFWPFLMDTSKQIIRFGSYYARLRAKDFLMSIYGT